MAFGVGLPILFPLTLIAIISLYIFERIFQVYWYQKSAMINDFLNKNALRILKWAVHFYTFFGYWFITNRQIFYDDVTPTMRRSDRGITNHTLYNIPYDQTFPLLIFMFLLLGIMILKSIYSLLIYFLVPRLRIQHLLSFEDLYCYYDSLEISDALTLVKEEEYRRKELKYSRLNDKTLNNLKYSASLREEIEENLTAEDKNILESKTI